MTGVTTLLTFRFPDVRTDGLTFRLPDVRTDGLTFRLPPSQLTDAAQ
jgi:hypothetical protein